MSDIESINGTKVNEDELTTPRRLRNGDLLHLGTIDLRFVSASPDSAPDELESGQVAGDGLSSSQNTIPLTPDAIQPPHLIEEDGAAGD